VISASSADQHAAVKKATVTVRSIQQVAYSQTSLMAHVLASSHFAAMNLAGSANA
jgi:hypothetical protein